ncbi:type II secretion system F family protein [Maricaulis sp.]|uniref:type II secretion system F family protein n=1 Tax=Maricaulis sp. TaxID=1486257 RepID=UPI002B277D57|nr:type II secretion system F family protein [Maricaulis sp.]
MTADPSPFRFLGETAQGAMESGELLATDIDQARQKLEARGLAVVELTPATRRQHLISGRASLNTRMLSDFTRSLADLVQSAVPVPDALQFIIDAESQRPIRLFAERIERAVRAGSSLSAAMAQDPAQPDRLLVSAVAAGERSGQLGVALGHVADRLERARDIRDMLVGQLVYPVILVGVIFLTLLFLSFFILPQFEAIFQAAGANPPVETRLVLSAGSFIRQFGLWLPAAAAFLAWCLMQVWRRNPLLAGRLQRSIPILGPAMTALDAAGYSRTMGVLLGTGVPLVRAAEVAAETISNVGDRTHLRAAIDAVRGGRALSQALTQVGGMPDALIRQIRLGEASGDLGRVFIRAASRYEREAEGRLKRLTELLGPTLIVALGSCVGIVIAAVLSGVLSLNDAIY